MIPMNLFQQLSVMFAGKAMTSLKCGDIYHHVKKLLIDYILCAFPRYSDQLPLTHYPDMVFPDNMIHLVHETSGIILEFNTLNAMKLISTQDTESIKVACSEAWQASK